MADTKFIYSDENGDKKIDEREIIAINESTTIVHQISEQKAAKLKKEAIKPKDLEKNGRGINLLSYSRNRW